MSYKNKYNCVCIQQDWDRIPFQMSMSSCQKAEPVNTHLNLCIHFSGMRSTVRSVSNSKRMGIAVAFSVAGSFCLFAWAFSLPLSALLRWSLHISLCQTMVCILSQTCLSAFLEEFVYKRCLISLLVVPAKLHSSWPFWICTLLLRAAAAHCGQRSPRRTAQLARARGELV